MSIAGWPMDRIMQLPDCCFGRRFPVACALDATEPGAVWDIAEVAFPERFVLWELSVWNTGELEGLEQWKLAMGDHLPAAQPEFDAMEPLIPGLGLQGAEPRIIRTAIGISWSLVNLKMPIAAMGRRMVIQVLMTPTGVTRLNVVAVVSSIPTEVPDWLISGVARTQ